MRRAAVRQKLDAEQERIRRLAYRINIVPVQLERARRRVAHLEAEAIDLGVIPALEKAHHAGDMIATEYLKRLGYFR